MPPSTRDLLAAVLGELPPGQPLQSTPAPAARDRIPPLPALPTSFPTEAIAPDKPPGPWRVTARMQGGKVQISNHRESRVVPKEHVETYLRGHGPAVRPDL